MGVIINSTGNTLGTSINISLRVIPAPLPRNDGAVWSACSTSYWLRIYERLFHNIFHMHITFQNLRKIIVVIAEW